MLRHLWQIVDILMSLKWYSTIIPHWCVISMNHKSSSIIVGIFRLISARTPLSATSTGVLWRIPPIFAERWHSKLSLTSIGRDPHLFIGAERGRPVRWTLPRIVVLSEKLKGPSSYLYSLEFPMFLRAVHGLFLVFAVLRRLLLIHLIDIERLLTLIIHFMYPEALLRSSLDGVVRLCSWRISRMISVTQGRFTLNEWPVNLELTLIN